MAQGVKDLRERIEIDGKIYVVLESVHYRCHSQSRFRIKAKRLLGRKLTYFIVKYENGSYSVPEQNEYIGKAR